MAGVVVGEDCWVVQEGVCSRNDPSSWGRGFGRCEMTQMSGVTSRRRCEGRDDGGEVVI